MTTVHIFALMAVLSMVDAISTVYFLSRTHMVEVNPFLRAVIARFGFVGLFVVKAALVAATAVLHYKWTPVPVEALYAVCAMFAGVTLWNVYKILRERSRG